MKQFILRIFVAVALLLPVTMSAQTLTVCDGTATEAHFPLYGLYMDAAQQTQMLYVDSMLTPMQGQAITELTYYGNASASFTSTMTVSMAVVSDQTVGGTFLTPTFTTVYTGQLAVQNDVLHIVLDDAFVYPSDGGNLLIQFQQTSGGNYSSVGFYGVSAPGMSLHDYSYGTASNFLPKVTFAYSTPSSCPRPSALQVSGIQGTDATIGWTENGTASAWSLIVSDTVVTDFENYDNVISAGTNPYTVSGLDYSTRYYVYVRSECGSEASYWQGPANFRSACGIPTAIPYFTNFDDEAHGAVPACWTALATGTSGAGAFPSVYNYSYNAHSGPNYFEMESSAGETELVALPTFSNDAPLQVSFYVRDYNTNALLEVGYIVNDSVFVPTDTIAVNQTAYDADPQVVYFQNVSGAYITPAFRTSKDGSYTIFIDDVTVMEIPSCIAPMHITIDSLIADSVFFSFDDSGEAGSYYAIVSDTLVTNFDEWSAVNFSETNGMIDQLLSNHNYYLYVQADCGSEQSAWAGPVAFRTPCYDYTAVPYFNDFENETIYELPSCWERKISTSYPHVYGYSYYAHSGNNSLYFYNYSYGSATVDQVVVLPEFEDLSVLKMSFYASAGGTLTVQVGVWDSNAFQSIETINLNSESGYQMYESYFNTYEGESHRPAIRVNGGYFELYIDDLMIDSASLCLPVNGLVASNPQSTSIDLNWTPRGEESSWNIVYDSVPVTDFANHPSMTNESSYPATVNGLNPGTHYYFYVRADCGGDVSAWEMCEGSTALCDGGCNITINMTDGYGDGWNGNKIAVVQSGVTVAEVTLASGSEGSASVLVCPNDTVYFLWSSVLYADECGFTIEDQQHLTVYTCDEGDALSFGSTAFFSMVTDCAAAACERPENLVIDSVSETTVDISWNGGATSWYVLYGTSPVAFGDANATVLTTGTPHVSVTGLNANTQYYFTIAADCGSDTSVVSTISARTNCGAITTLPWTETFASGSAYDAPLCWNVIDVISTGYADYPAIDQYSSNNTPQTLEFYTSTSYGSVNTIATPAFSGVTMSDLQVEFYEQSYAYTTPNYLVVGVMEDTVFVAVDTIVPVGDGSFNYHVVYLSNYTGNGDRFAFRVLGTGVGSYAYLYLDDITVSVAPDCHPVQNLTANETSATEIQANWNGVAGATYNVVVSDTLVTNFDALTPVVAGTNSATVSNLQSGTIYNVYVQTDCGTSTSPWVGPVQVLCGGYIIAANSADTLSTCGMVLLDDGGFTGGYSDSQTSTLVLLPDTAMSAVAITGSLVSESGWDYLRIYDGIGTDGAQLYNYSGTDNNINVVSTSGPLTVQFHADGSTNGDGFVLSVNCVSLTCLAVSEVEVTHYGATTLTIGWTVNGNENQWDVVFDTVPISDPDNYTATTVNTPSYTVTGLEALNTYYFAIRANCGAGDVSTWTYFDGRTTICDNANVLQTGNGTLSTSYVPGFSYFNYSYSATIIDSAELVGMTEISAFAFQTLSVNGGNKFNNCQVYLGPVDVNVFGPSPIAIDSSFVKVYDGDLNYSTVGWQIFMFDTVYNYSGQGNLMLVVDRNDGTYASGSSFAATACNGAKTIYQYADNVNVDPANPTASNANFTIDGYRANYQLISCVGGCAKPTLTNVSGLNYEQATINWASNAENFEVAIMNNGTWSAEAAVNNAYTYTFTNLQPQTTYQYRVRAICDAAEGLISDWSLGSFTTEELPCFAPTAVQATPGFTSAVVDWTPGTSETHWSVRVYNTAFDSTYAVTAHPCTIAGLNTNTTYNVTVLALCGTNGTVPSDNWSDTISFATDQCDAPTNLTATVNQNSAVLTWTPGANNTGNWIVEYGPQGFTSGTGTTINATTNTVTLSDLEWDQDYDAYVRANCEAGALSTWSNKASFTTPRQQVGIENVNAADMSIFPNPASGNTSISLSGMSGDVRLMIVDMNGRTVRTEQMTCDGTCVKVVDVEGLASGAYFVRVMSDNFNTVKKLVVK